MSVDSDISVTRLSWNPGVRIVTEIVGIVKRRRN